jgi:hypothetical protein
MLPPRAESVDSFSYQRPPGDRPAKTALADSPRPAEGLSRRGVLAGLAILPVAHPVTGWATTEDPVFDAIAKKRAADVAHDNACGELNDAELRYGVGSDEAEDVFVRGGPACDAAQEAAWELARVQPTTLAGVLAVLRFGNELEDRGMEWPDTDTIGRQGWHYQFRATMATAIEVIARQEVRA